jgi:Tfp pilus assembly protein PilO
VEKLIKQLHWIIVLYTATNVWFAFEDHTAALETKQASLTSAEAYKAKLKRKLKQIDKFKKNLQASQERVQAVIKQIEKLQKQLPSDSNDAEIQNYLGSKANKLLMRNPAPAPGDEKNNGFYLSRAYSFTASSTFLQFLIFMENIKESERILNVTKFEVKHSGSGDRSSQQILDVKTEIESYRYNKDYKGS